MLHERDLEAEQRKYRIWPLAENWRGQGIDVRIVRGPKPCTDSDVLVPHLDCSYTPDPYWDVIQNHPRAVNARVRDIRKTAISANLLHKGDAWDGPVIVKTNNNSGGYMDLEYGNAAPPSKLDTLRKRAAWHPWIQPRSLGWTRTLTKYPIFEHPSDVPGAAWKNPHLVIEKFLLPDCDERGEHVVYLWIVLGHRGIGRTLHSPDRYVKNLSSRLGSFDQPPPEILGVQERFGLDYGKIDYILHMGRPVLLDINRTPTVSGDAFSQAYIHQCAPLAPGIGSVAFGARSGLSGQRGASENSD